MISEMLSVFRTWVEPHNWADDFRTETIFPKKSDQTVFLIVYDKVWAYGKAYDFVEEYHCYDSLDAALCDIPEARRVLTEKGHSEVGIVELSSKGRRWVLHLRDLTFDTPTNIARLT